VSPGAITTDGATLFNSQKSDDLVFCSHRLQKVTTFLVIVTTPTLFAFQIIIYPVFFLNSAGKN